MQRVSYVTMGFPEPSETFTSHDVRAMHERGVAVHVHALRPPNKIDATLRQQRQLEDVPVTQAGLGSLVGGVAAALRAPGSSLGLLGTLLATCWRQPGALVRSLILLPRVWEVSREIKVWQPQVVHVSWAHFPAMVGWLVQRTLPSTVVSISFSAYDIEARYGLTAYVAQGADVVRTLARSNVDEIADTFGVPKEQIVVVHDGIPVDAFDLPTKRVPGRLASVGRLAYDKGMDAVISVFAQLHSTDGSLTLQIVGEGEERASLERQAGQLGVADAIQFLGFQPQERVASVLSEAEVFLFLSRTERLPNVIKEAMAAGCACVVSRTHGVEELVPDVEHGTVVDIDDIAAATVAAKRFLQTPALREAVGEAGRTLMRREFALQATIDRYQDLWCQAIKKSPMTAGRA